MEEQEFCEISGYPELAINIGRSYLLFNGISVSETVTDRSGLIFRIIFWKVGGGRIRAIVNRIVGKDW